MHSIPGSMAFELFTELREKYGIKQTAIAAIIGVSRQAVTDMKAGRRRFTRVMAKKLIKDTGGEPWHNWLKMKIEDMFSSAEATSPIKPGPFLSSVLPPPVPICSSEPVLPHFSFLPPIAPVLLAPCRGEPEASPNYIKRKIALPDDLAAQATKSVNPYVLIIDSDSRDGRLRRGDWVLVVQEEGRESEIMVIEYNGALRLAQRARHQYRRERTKKAIVPDDAWVMLDSGTIVPSENVTPAGCVVGIVMALL